MSDTLVSLYYRLTSTAYDPFAVLFELVLIGLCVHWSANILQGTRGTRPLRGVLIILVVMTMVVRVTAAQFGWVRLDLLYSYVLYALAFIALVVFQPELRRAVIRVGDVRFQRRGAPKSQLVSALVKSAGYLSRNRYGALIAIQRGVDLTGWAENGTMIRAEVSSNLLNAIFFPNSPLHDLGVIIRGNRVIAANCQFPVAESDEVDSALGSRHLAALGMSYETDALVLVISEETGVVSLADKGKLTRYLSLDDLADELTDRLSGVTVTDARRKRSVASSVWLRMRRALVVVPLTLVIWYLADQATLATDNFRIQLDVDSTQPTTTIDLDAPQPLVFRATFTGPGRAIDRLRADAAQQPLRIAWELPDSYERPGDYELSSQSVQAIIEESREIRERGLTVADVGLDELRFSVDRLVTLTCPVVVDGGAVRIATERVTPPTADVVVRQRDLERLPPEQERAVRANVASRLEGATPEEPLHIENIPLEPRIAGIDLVTVDPESVDVTVRVLGQRRRIANVVVYLFVSPDVYQRYRVEKTDLNEWRIDVEVEGKRAVVEALSPLDIDAFVHVTSQHVPTPGAIAEYPPQVLEVLVRTPDDIRVVGQRTVRVSLIPRTGGVP
jgi:diadenylate cyclase